MTTWIINSAVIPVGADGAYRYRTLTEADFTRALLVTITGGLPWRHTLGYQATCNQVEELLAPFAPAGLPLDQWEDMVDGILTPVRESYTLEPGEMALVVRLDQRVADPKTKHEQRPQSWDYGVLERIA